MVATEASASGSSDVGLESSAAASGTESGHLYWHWWPVHREWLVKLVRLREARPNITSQRLSREWHFPLAILLHLSELVLNNDGLIDQVLEISVVGVEQLELNVIIQSVQEHVLLLLVGADVVGGIPRQLDE